MGICDKVNERKSISQNNSHNNSQLYVYFNIEEREYAFPCSKGEVMKNVVMRFCQQHNMKKTSYSFIHNNRFLNENSRYNDLFTIQDNKRIIYVEKKSETGTMEKLNMESIISKINYQNIKKQDYKYFYRDEGILSDDGYYKIHEASKKNTTEKFAIKIFDFNNIISEYKTDEYEEPKQRDMEAFVRGLIEQSRIISTLSRDNINVVQIYECFLTKDEFAIVMELCDTDMNALFSINPVAYSLDQVYKILIQLNNTFRIMANNNIIHGDLKLDNILVKYINSSKNSYILKLTDFGVSNKYILDINRKFGAKNAISQNMPPEMLRSEDSYGPECDLWSLGILIHLLLTKKHPYPGNNDYEVLNSINRNGMKSIVKTGNHELDHLLRRLLTKNPKDRLTWKEYFEHPFFTGGDYWVSYSKEKQLGKGKYYTVWKCKNINRDEYRAIKIIDFKTIRSAFTKQ